MYDVGIISGYFNPPHIGHLDYIYHSAKQCKRLIAIVNSDKQIKLKGAIPLLDEKTRLELIGDLQYIYFSVLAIDDDITVAKTIKDIKQQLNNPSPEYTLVSFAFFNSGDRTKHTARSAESQVCQELDIDEVFLDLPKVNSSSKIIMDAVNYVNNLERKNEYL